MLTSSHACLTNMTPLPIATTGPEQAMMNQTKKILEEHSQEQYDPDVSRSTLLVKQTYPNVRICLTIPALSSFLIPVACYPDEEPLLKQSRRRFVLFPIQYPEVSLQFVSF